MKAEGKSITELSRDALQRVYTNAILDTNTQCHNAAFDDTLSGTTAICVLVLGRFLYVANVGDSRAIICSEHLEEKGKILAEPLSIDQTPFRKDERERVKKWGARVRLGEGKGEAAGGHLLPRTFYKSWAHPFVLNSLNLFLPSFLLQRRS